MTTTIIDHIVRFLEINRSLGYRFEKNEEMLRSFARFAEARNETYVRSETALEWASASRAASSTFQVTKLRAVRDFAVWLHAEDDRHEIPPRDALGAAEPAATAAAPDIGCGHPETADSGIVDAACRNHQTPDLALPVRSHCRDRSAHGRSARSDAGRHHARRPRHPWREVRQDQAGRAAPGRVGMR